MPAEPTVSRMSSRDHIAWAAKKKLALIPQPVVGQRSRQRESRFIHQGASKTRGATTLRDQRGPIRVAAANLASSRCRAGGQSTGISTSVKLPGVAALTAATTSATCG